MGNAKAVRWGCFVLSLLLSAGCTIRQVPLSPALEPLVDDQTPRANGQWVAMVMDPRVIGFTKERTYSLTQEERYASGNHFVRSLLAQLRTRGVTVLEVDSERMARELGAPVILLPDAPGLGIIRPKGLLDFSALGSINRISVTYAVRYFKEGKRIPERVSGTGTRTASFFWSNAFLQSLAFTGLGVAVSTVIYGLYFGLVFYQNAQTLRQTGQVDTAKIFKSPPAEVAVSVFVADMVVSQFTAQLVPRVINPLLDVFINEPRWESMVQSAHDTAVQELADNVVRKLTAAWVTP